MLDKEEFIEATVSSEDIKIISDEIVLGASLSGSEIYMDSASDDRYYGRVELYTGGTSL